MDKYLINKKFLLFFGFISFIPLWIFHSNFNTLEIFFLLIFFLILPFFLHFIICKKINSNSKKIYFWLSIVTFYSIDQNLGLWSFFDNLNFIFIKNNYFKTFALSFLLIILIYFLFFSLNNNGLIIIFSFIIVLFLFNVINNVKSLSSFPKSNLMHNYDSKPNHYNKKLILVLDEMSGLKNLDLSVKNERKVNKNILDFFKKNNFEIYLNAHSLFKDTERSLSSTLNFVTNKKYFEKTFLDNDKLFIGSSQNYFIVKELKQNNFFDLDYNKNIVVQQNMYLDYCAHKKVIICNQYNPFLNNINFLTGFKNTYLTKYVSYYKINGSVISRLLWRFFFQLRLVDTRISPYADKPGVNYIFEQMFQAIKNNPNTSLFYSHILIPHTPYGFTDSCEYDGSLAVNFSRISINERKFQHNLEKMCVIYFLDNFFNMLKESSLFENLEIIIFSDHDSRIDESNTEDNVIFVHKKINSKKYIVNHSKISINDIFKLLNYN